MPDRDLRSLSLRRLFGVVLVCFILSGCGVAYVSAQVPTTDPNVTVTPLTAQSVAIANQETRAPAQLPAAFSQTAGAPTSLRGAGVMPTPSVTEQPTPQTVVARLPPDVSPGPYRMGVGDVVLLATRSSAGSIEELSGLLAAQNSRQGYTIQDDGAIAVPKVGRIMLEGQTLEEAEAHVFQRLVESRIDPTFSLEIAEFNSKRVAVGGAVSVPTNVPISLTPLYLDAAITLAGGIATPDVAFTTIRIYRQNTLYQIPLAEYLRLPALQKTRLSAGDSIYVDTQRDFERAQVYFEEQIALAQFQQNARTQALAALSAEVALRRAELDERRRNFQEREALDAVPRAHVYLTGEVGTAGRYPLPFGRQATLADALFSAGGFAAETGNPRQIYVLRSADSDLAAVTAWHLDGSKITNMVLATRMNLLPNDIVFVAEQPVTRWNRVVQQIVPSLVTSSVAAVTN